MAFLVYFFVLVVMAGSVVFGLDAVNAPLHGPAQQAKSEHGAHHKRPAANASTDARRAQIATSVGRHQPKPVTQQQHQTATIAAPTEQKPETDPIPQNKPEVVAQHEPPVAAPPLPPERPRIASATQAKPETAAQQKPETVAQRKPETVAQEQPSAGNAPSTEHSTVGAATETHKAQAKRGPPRRASAQAPAPAPTQTQVRRHEERRQTAHDDDSRVPSWAIRGAESARREAGRDEHAAGREEHARAPSWAIRGADSAAREADHDAPARETFGSSWHSEPAWHFGWQ